MALKVFEASNEENQRERVIVYGRAGVGKTRFTLSLTPRFGDILYYAADENSEFLGSISAVKRARVHVLKPQGDDPIANFQEFCVRDWRQHYPTVKSLVIDTYTKVADDSIQHSANTGAVTAEKHFKVGDPAKGGQVIPNRGDYQAVEYLSRGYLDRLFLHQAHYHIFLICHEDMKVIEGAGISLGGPSHPGRKMAEDLPGKVNTVIRLTREPIMVPPATLPEMRVVAITAHSGAFIAKFRESNETTGNPLPRFVCGIDPTNFWQRHDEIVLAASTK